MNIKNLTRTVFKGSHSVTEVLVWIGYVALAAIVLIVFVDVLGRYFLNKPLRGAYELVALASGILGGFAIMYTTVKRGHAAIDLIVCRLSRRAQTIMQRVASLVGLGSWAVLAYWVFLNALGSQGEASTIILGLPMAPFLLIIAIATFLCCLILLIQTFHPGEETLEEGKESYSDETPEEI